MENKEIDRLIIEKVLELPYHETEWFGYWVVLKEGQLATLFSPSSNIQDAWIALEKFKEKDFLYTVQNQVGGNYEVSLTDWGGMCSTFRGVSESLPLAICQATLKAKGIEI
ncbi:hypothetical protein P4639_14290 [Priestia megaterium]|uniref:BC1872 family protein n=1 Tax=Priestia megaterium TaxID=1404 RepID=UPI002E1AB877|nr:hypothetical protein [Priestia megaterium]